jgi:hypothetical protein
MTTLAVIGPCTIRAGESVSDPIDCSGSIRVIRVITPPNWSAGASLSFMLSPDGVEFHDLHQLTHPGDAYRTFEVVAPNPPVDSAIVLPLDHGGDIPWLKVRSGTSGVPIVQSADRAFSFVCEFPDTIPAPARRAAGAAGKTGWLRLGRGADGSTIAIWRSSSGRIVVTPPGKRRQ